MSAAARLGACTLLAVVPLGWTAGASWSASKPADLTISVDSTGPAVAGQASSFSVVVTNAGGAPAFSPVNVSFSPQGGVSGSPAAAGAGWQCDASGCTTGADVAPGAGLPPLMVTVPVVADRTTNSTTYGRVLLNASVGGGDDAESGNNSASASAGIRATNLIDAALTLRPPGTPPVHGQTASFEALVTNLGADSLRSRVEVVYSGALSGQGTGWTCPSGAGRCITDSDVAAGATLPMLLLREPADAATTSVSARIETTDDAVTQNNSGSATTSAQPLAGADLVVGLRPGAAASQGGLATATAVVTNAGAVPTAGPIEMTYPAEGSASGTGWTCPSGAGRCITSGIAGAGSSLPSLQVRRPTTATDSTASLAVTVSGGGDGLAQNNSASTTVPLTRIGDPVDILATATPAYDAATREATWRVDVTNTGATAAAGDTVVRVDDPYAYPAFGGSRFLAVRLSGDGWTCTMKSCLHAGPVGPGAPLPPLTASATLPPDGAAGTTSFSATVISDDDAHTANNAFSSQSTTGGVGVDLVPIVRTTTSVRAGQPGTGTVEVRNLGAKTASGPVQASIDASMPVAKTSVSGAGWQCGTDLVCTHPGPVPAGATLPTLQVTGLTDTQSVTTQTFRATVKQRADEVPGDDSGSATFGAGGQLDDVIPAITVDGPWRSGATGRARVVIANAGPTARTRPVTVRVSTGYPAVARGDGWTCAATLECTFDATITAGASSPPLELYAQVTATGTPTNSAVSATLVTAGDDYPQNDDASATVPILATSQGAGLQVRFTRDRSGDVDPGQAEHVVLSVRNAGATDAAGPMSLRLAPSQSIVVESVAGAGWTCDASLLCQRTLSIPAGESSVLDLSVRPSSSASSLESLVATVRQGAVPAISASLPLPLATLSGVDLVQEVESVRPTVAGAASEFRVRVRNGGEVSERGRVEVRLTAYGRVGGAVVGGGDGWRCPAATDRCVTDADVPPGGALPDLTVLVPTPRGTPGSSIALRSDLVGVDDDAYPANDVGQARSPVVAQSGVDLTPSVNITPDLQSGQPASSTVTVRNQGADDATGQVLVRWSISGSVATSPEASGDGWACTESRCVHAGPVPAGTALPPIVIRHDTIAQRSQYYGYAMLSVAAYVDHGQDAVDTNNAISQRAAVLPAGGVDLAVRMHPVSPTFGVGEQRSYTAVVRNVGDDTSTAPIELAVPGGWTASGSGWVCPRDASRCRTSSGVAPTASLPPVTLVDPTLVTRPGTTSATVSVLSSQDQEIDDDSGSVSVPIVARANRPDLVATLQPAAAPVAGSAATFTATVRNAGEASSTDAITATVGPADATASGTGWSCASHICTSNATVPAGAELPPLSIVVPTTADTGSTSAGVHLASGGETSTENNDASATVGVRRSGAAADLRLDSALSTTSHPGSTIVWDLLAVNDSGAPTGSEVTLNANVYLYPRYLEATASGDGWTCQQLVCTHAPLAAGEHAPAVHVAITGPVADGLGQVQLYAGLNAAGDEGSNNNVSFGFGLGGVQRDAVVVLDSPHSVRFDEDLVQTATVRNIGTQQLAGPVVLTISRSPGSAGMPTGTGWSCDTSSRCTHPGPIPDGESLPAITLLTPADRTDGARSASLSADVDAPGDELNADDTASLTVSRGTAQIDLAPQIVAGPPTRLHGTATFDVTVRNGGARTSTQPGTLSIDAPAGSTASGDGWVCTTTLSCSTDASVPPRSALPALHVIAPARARDGLDPVTVTAQISASDDQYSPDNRVDAGVPVGGPAVDLTALVRPLGRWRAGSTATFRTDVANSGTGVATADVDLTLNTPYNGAEATGENWVCTTNLHCLHGGPVPAGGTLPPLNVSVPIPLSATPSQQNVGVSLDSDSDDITTNNSTDLVTGLERKLEVRRAALFDGEAQRSRLPLGGSTRVAVQFADGVDPQHGKLTALIPTGLRLDNAGTGSGLLQPVSQSVADGTQVTWDIGPGARSFTVVARSDAAPGSRTIRLQLESELTVQPEVDDAPLTVVRPRIDVVAPLTLSNRVPQTLTISGTDLDTSHRVVLSRGAVQITGTRDSTTPNTKSVLVDLSPLTTGPVSLALVADDGTAVATAPQALTVATPVYRDPEISVVGPSRVRLNSEAFAYVSVFNPSNADIRNVPLVVAVPPGVDLRPDGAGGRELLAAVLDSLAAPTTEPRFRLTAAEYGRLLDKLPEGPPVEVDPASGGKQTIVIMPRIPAGGTARLRVGLTPRAEVTAPIRAFVRVDHDLFVNTGIASDVLLEMLKENPDYRAPASRPTTAKRTTLQDARNEITCDGLDADTCAYLDKPVRGIEAGRGLGSKYGCVSFAALTFGLIGNDCNTDPIGPAKEYAIEKTHLGWLDRLKSGFGLYNDLDDAYSVVDAPTAPTQFGVRSVDPNDKLSPAGYGDEHWITGDDSIPYTIRFENVRTATAAAQQVRVTDALPAELDASTVQLVSAEIGGVPVSLTPTNSVNTTAASGSAILDPLTGRDVLLDVDLDKTTRKLTATFRGSPHLDDPISPTAFGDFLPPNDDKRIGEGSITLTAKPKSGLGTGATIENVAAIVFDPHADGPTIVTPAARNRLDRTAPTVHAPTDGATVGRAMTFSAADDGAGVADITVTAIKDGVAQTPTTVAPAARNFAAPSSPGSYEFLVVVTDGVGRVSRDKSAALTIVPESTSTPPTDPTPTDPAPPPPPPLNPSVQSPTTTPQVGTTPSAPTPPKAVVRCKPPRLKNKTLAAAKKAITAAHCKLGKVTKPSSRTKLKKGYELTVRKQSGTKSIAVTLAPTRKRR